MARFGGQRHDREADDQFRRRVALKAVRPEFLDEQTTISECLVSHHLC